MGSLVEVMTGSMAEKRSDAVCGDGLMGLLQKLDHSEILEVLSGGFCKNCEAVLEDRVRALMNKKFTEISLSNVKTESSSFSSPTKNGSETSSWGPIRTPESVSSVGRKEAVSSSSPVSVSSKPHLSDYSKVEILLNDGLGGNSSVIDTGLSEEEKEQIRLSQIGRKKDFVHIERIDGRTMNVIQGLELHTRVFNSEEQKKIVECVYNLQRMGQKGMLRERTYSEPKKWMRGKGRVTIQFGCCYNYAVDKNGNPPGIIREEEVDPLPPLFKQMIKRMVRWHILPPTCVPNSCIVNIYDEGDCIPPHIDHHDFLRPFCTVSFLTECNILFGSSLKILDAGEFSGPVSISLPKGSVLILNGNGADVAKHCVPAVPAKRISITFRKMDESRLPYKYSPDPELLNVRPLAHRPLINTPLQQQKNTVIRHESRISQQSSSSPHLDKDDFPPLGAWKSDSRKRGNKNGLRQ